MANPIITNYDTKSGIRKVRQSEQGYLTLGSTVTQKKVSVLSKILATAGAVTAGSNTGNGTVTVFSIGLNETPEVGNHTFEMTGALVGKLISPSGNEITGLAIADGDAAIIKAGGLVFTVTDGSTAFIAGDEFTLAVANGTGKYIPYTAAGTAGASAPCAISLNEVTSVGAGDYPAGIMLAGEVDADFVSVENAAIGTGMTEEIKNSLHNYGIFVEDYKQTASLDNQ